MLRKQLCRAGVAVLLLAISFPSKATAQNEVQKEQDVGKVLISFVDMWNQNRLKTSFGKLFTDDADFVFLSGMYLKGGDQIVAHHLEIRSGV